MCGIWDWQSTIVKDLNDSQDLKTPNIRCFVAKTHLSRFTRFIQTTNVRFLPVQGGGSPKAGIVCFLPFFLYDGFPYIILWQLLLVIVCAGG